MAVRLKYGLLCDYATTGALGKATAIHIFDHFVRKEGDEGKALPDFTVLMRLECSLADGVDHTLTAVIVNEDGHTIQSFPFPQHRFGVQGPGLPLTAQLLFNIRGLQLPGFGTYDMELREGEVRVGSVDFKVVPMLPKLKAW